MQIPSATRAMQILENFRNYIVGPEERREFSVHGFANSHSTSLFRAEKF